MSQSPKDHEKILKHIANHKSMDHDERKLTQRASKQRKASKGKRKRERLRKEDALDLEDDLPAFEKLGRASGDSLNEWVDRMKGPESTVDTPVDDTLSQATVLSIGPGWCRIEADGEVVDCDLASDLAAVQRTALAVGDEVLFDADAEPNPKVMRVLPRRTSLTRADPGNKNLERAVVANVDVVVVVASARTPPLHPRLFDRYLLAIERGGAEPLICVNKVDLCESAADRAEIDEALAPYRELGVDVVLCSARDKAGIQELAARLAGRTCAFVGHSGVGKSSVLNALQPGLMLDTGDVRWTDGKGRHTTTSSMLYELPNGTRIADTPGIRQFGFSKLTLDDVRAGFSEFGESAADCHFSDCTHVHEPKCGVKSAVEEGRIHRGRYATWLRLVDELGS